MPTATYTADQLKIQNPVEEPVFKPFVVRLRSMPESDWLSEMTAFAADVRVLRLHWQRRAATDTTYQDSPSGCENAFPHSLPSRHLIRASEVTLTPGFPEGRSFACDPFIAAFCSLHIAVSSEHR